MLGFTDYIIYNIIESYIKLDFWHVYIYSVRVYYTRVFYLSKSRHSEKFGVNLAATAVKLTFDE